MLNFLYITLTFLAQPFLLLNLYIKGIKHPAYRERIGERFGFYGKSSPPAANGLLLHAASVGEVMLTLPIVRELKKHYPNLPITFTTVTPTGSNCVKNILGDSVNHYYLPYDSMGAMKRLLKFVQPKLCITIESEIWPNLSKQLKRYKIPFIVANARISARSYKNYKKIQKSFSRVLSRIELIATQDKITYQRFYDLGCRDTQLSLTGNIKFDVSINDHLLQQTKSLKEQLPNKPIWIASSTHEGEDEIILKTHRTLLKQFPDLLLIIVPRHPQRFSQVEELIKKGGFSYCKKSLSELPTKDTQVWLGDTMGELLLLYGIC